MRISPKSPSPPDALAQAIADQVAAEQTPKTSPAAIDARRAQQLLERANSLAGRGDLGAAILATRQSMALAPGSIEGQLLLADLLERNRDFSGARAAYQKGVQLAPDRADARDSVARLSAYLEQSQDAARQFHFDSDELFAPQSNSDAPESNSDAPENNAAEVAAAAPISTHAENSTGGPIAIEVEASQGATGNGCARPRSASAAFAPRVNCARRGAIGNRSRDICRGDSGRSRGNARAPGRGGSCNRSTRPS